ncbi:MAG: transposase [Planctomycetota bacterium]|nr:MAG: transposase [Planctomycetota bacterium]
MEAARIRRYELTDEPWGLIEDLSPVLIDGLSSPLVTNGRPWHDHRTMVNAMLWVLNTGSPWRDVSKRYGAWQTARNRFRHWRKDGTFDRILQRLQIRLDEKGRIDWDLWMVDGSSVRAHAAAAGAGKKGAPTNPRITHWVAREAGLGRKSTWFLTVTELRSPST